jgi:hypothetical protein
MNFDEAKAEATGKAGFERWSGQSTVRMLMSMIPPGEHPEALKTLLMEAFKSGFAMGASYIALDMMQEMMSRPKPDATTKKDEGLR